jgi:hypothetical protein
MKGNYQDSSEFKGNVKRIRDQVIEEFTGIEELCSMVSFFFLKLYNIQTFREKSKYFLISKQVVFFALQRSLGKIESLEKNLDFMFSLELLDKDFLIGLVAIKKSLQRIETAYNKNKIKEVVDRLKEIGVDVSSMKNNFKQFKLGDENGS